MPNTTAKPARAKTAPAKNKTPKFTPAPAALKARFAEIVAKYPEAQTRSMFGYPCAFVNGQMFFCTFGEHLMLRLAEPDRAKFLARYDARLFEPMPGRPMKEYVEVPVVLVDSDEELHKWLVASLAYAAAIGPKRSKSKKTRTR